VMAVGSDSHGNIEENVSKKWKFAA